ncbi:hypothetical protein ACLESD_46130 [Pyxidicoccus sp. 3LFB2]
MRLRQSLAPLAGFERPEVLQRHLRARYAAHPISTNYAYVPVKDAAGRHYQLYLRDALPLEDARGLVRPPEG